jgi:hypothetical protein
MIPPALREQCLREYLLWKEHWRVPSLVLDDGRGFLIPGAPVVHVVPYSRLSRPESTVLLESIKPDLIIADEAHRLRYPRTAGTGRFIRYFAAHEETRFAGWSGTVTGKSLLDYQHLSALALREESPLPIDPDTAAEWDLALGTHDWPAPPGALRKLGSGPVRKAFNRRLTGTRGVIATIDAAASASLNFYEHKTTTPRAVAELLCEVRQTWTRPDGEEFVEVLEVKACARQLASGFYYRWRFPRGESEDLIMRWRAARKAWHKELREKLKIPREHLDSPMLLANAAERARTGYAGDLPKWEARSWVAWREIKDEVQPTTEAVWVDDWLAHDAAAWSQKNRGVVWCDLSAFGHRVAELAGLPYHGGGPNAEKEILAETGARSVIASWHAHGTGRDGLQRHFREQYVVQPPASGTAWEQLLGRLHRVGQEGDEVDTWVPRHETEVREALDSAILQCRYVAETTGAAQKLLSATFAFEVDTGFLKG